MAWWDSLIETVFNFAKSNPATTGAIVSGLTGGFQGKYGENNLANIAGGAALGYGAGKVAEYLGGSGAMTPTFTGGTAPTPPTGGSVGLSIPGATGAAANTVVQGAGSTPNVWGYAADGMGPPASAMGTSVGLLDEGMAGLEKIGGVAKKYQPLLDIGAKGVSALAAKDAAEKQEEYMRKYQQQSDAAMASQQAAADKTNKAREDVYLDQRAQVAGAGLEAQKGVDVRTAGDIAELNQNKTLSSAARAALKQKALVAGSKAGAQAFSSADKAARAGLSAPTYSSVSSPTYSSTYANDIASASKAGSQGMMELYEDVTGLRKKKATEQVGENSSVITSKG